MACGSESRGPRQGHGCSTQTTTRMSCPVPAAEAAPGPGTWRIGSASDRGSLRTVCKRMAPVVRLALAQPCICSSSTPKCTPNVLSMSLQPASGPRELTEFKLDARTACVTAEADIGRPVGLWPEPCEALQLCVPDGLQPIQVDPCPAEPSLAIAADRNPWMDAPAAKARNSSRFSLTSLRSSGTAEPGLVWGIPLPTEEAGAERPVPGYPRDVRNSWSYCGLENDNIYTSWDGADKTRGQPPTLGSQPAGEKDSLLVNDPPVPRK